MWGMEVSGYYCLVVYFSLLSYLLCILKLFLGAHMFISFLSSREIYLFIILHLYLHFFLSKKYLSGISFCLYSAEILPILQDTSSMLPFLKFFSVFLLVLLTPAFIYLHFFYGICVFCLCLLLKEIISSL